MSSEPGCPWKWRTIGWLITGWERPSGGAWESYTPMISWWSHKTWTGWNTQWTFWSDSSESISLRPTSPSHERWRANPAYFIWGCRRSPRLWSERGWDNCTMWNSEEGSHARSVELSLPWGQWRHTADACTGRNPQYTGDSSQSVRRITNLRFTMWDFCGRLGYALAPFLVVWGLPTRGIYCAYNLSSSTGGIGSGSWRKIPTPSPGASAAGTKYHQGD